MTRDTSAYPTLRHYITVYGEQTEKLLRSYVDGKVPAHAIR